MHSFGIAIDGLHGAILQCFSVIVELDQTSHAIGLFVL